MTTAFSLSQAVEAEYELVEDSSPLDSLPSSPLVLEDSPPSSPLAEESFEMVTGRGEEGGLGPQDTSLLSGLPPTPHNSSVDLTREVTPLASLKSGVEALISELSTGQEVREEGEATSEVEKEAKEEAVKEVVEVEEKVKDVEEKVEEVEAIGTIREEVEESEQR